MIFVPECIRVFAGGIGATDGTVEFTVEFIAELM
jgi:hypothetical protein